MADSELEVIQRELLEELIAEGRKQWEIIERCDTIIRMLNRRINGASETTNTDDLYRMLQRVERAKQQAQTKMAEIRRQIERLLNSGGGVPPPGGGGGTGGGTIPPIPPSVVNLEELGKVVKAVPSQQVFSSWGTHVQYPEMINQHHKVPNPQGTHALIHQGGTGAGGILAAQTPALLLKRCWLEGTGGPGYGAHTRWNCRAFGSADWTIEDSYIFNNPDEHGFYCNTIWNMAARRCIFEEIGSQAVQIVWRQHEAVDFEQFKDPYGDGTRSLMLVEDCAFIEVGKPDGGRPSFALSFFELQPWAGTKECDVVVQGCYFESKKYDNYEKSGGPYHSYGAIMVHGHRDVYIRKSAIRYRKPNRDMFQIWNCDNVIIEECEVGDPFDNAGVVLDIRNCNKVTIKGCTGNAVVQIAKSAPLYTWPVKYDYVGAITEDVEV